MIRYLGASTVQVLLPEPRAQLALVRDGFQMLRDGMADAPATPEIAPRPGAFAHAMPSYLTPLDVTALKWIAGNPNNRERGLPYLSGLIVVNDSETGMPIGILDCAGITAARTAAVSAVCIERFAKSGWSTLAIIGYGVQAQTHIELLRSLFREIEIRVFSRRFPAGRNADVVFASSAREAVGGSDIVVTGMPLEVYLDPPIRADWLTANALLLPLDDDASLDRSVALSAARFYVDDSRDFEIRCRSGKFAGWRRPDGVVADALLDDQNEHSGVTLCANQGIGLFDALFAHAVLEAADRVGAGILLER